MAFAHAQNINVPNSTFNEVGRDQYFQISNRDNVDPSAQGLLQLQPSPMDYSTRVECLPETRVDLLKSIEDWTNSTSVKQSVLVLYGLAGAGKSTLSTTFANRCRNAGRLGAFLFFNRDVVQRNDPKPVIRTIAYQIAFFDPRIEAAVSAAVKSIPNVCFLTLQVQFRKLIVEPLLSVRQQGPLSGKFLGKLLPRKSTKPVAVVVLDAFDECGDPISRKNLLEVLAEETATLAPIVRFVITSRAESDICSSFASRSHIAVRQLDTTTQVNAADIQRYLQHRAKITIHRNPHLQLRGDWPGADVIQKLVDQAGGLFVWATTAWAFIDTAYYPQKHLDMLLKGQVPRMAEATLDNLYSTALESVSNWDSEDFVNDFRRILGTIIAAKDPLSSTAIDQLLEMPPEQPSMHTISRLACVLSQGPVVRVLHPSFADFLCTQTRCGRDIWFIDPIVQNRALAIQCLHLLDGVLTMNLRDLTLSADIKTETVLEGVMYACVFWIDHICKVEEDIRPVVVHLDTFLNTHLLHWFEVMSILKRSRDTILLLNKLSTWITTNAPDQSSLHELVRDACRFAQTFANSIEEHPLVVYFGALSFAPLTSVIYRKFHHNTLFPSVIGGFEQSWSPLLLTFAGHGGPVTSAVFSPDGTRIISGSHDKTIRVLDMQSGVEVVPTMHGHKGFIFSISCSPDGTRVASSSDDTTIRVWDVSSGTQIVRMRGHRDWILSVAFSYDGTRIVSGSRDNTIRIWDALSGVELVPAMVGHQDSVYSAVFSPDDTRIVSSSRDTTIRIWDALTGEEVLPAICGHDSFVFSVAFSPDGTRIVSGSRDSTIRVWDASSGTEIVRAKCGHGDWVLSVAFSPDGKRIVSGSLNNAVRIWDASSGIEVVSQKRNHQSIVLSVMFSPDGTYVVSGSQDRTVRVWAATSCTEVVPATYELPDTSLSIDPRVVTDSTDGSAYVEDELPDAKATTALPRRQDEGGIFQVVFSPDGTRVVSGSTDNTIRIWDALSGAEIATAVHDHQDLFFSVMFSPDGTRVIARSSDGTDIGWDAASGIQLFAVTANHTTNDTSHLLSPRIIEVNSDGWLVHVPTHRTIFKLPAMITPLCSASHGSLLAIGTQGGQVIIMTFPSAMFTRSETRPALGKRRQRRKLKFDWDSEAK